MCAITHRQAERYIDMRRDIPELFRTRTFTDC